MNFEELRLPWSDSLKTCAITVCDLDGVVLYQNKRSVDVNGHMEGRSMMPCHSSRSREIINRLITNGENNSYTIQKGALRKLIYQTPWYESDEVAGLVEFSLEIPDEMPHYVRGEWRLEVGGNIPLFEASIVSLEVTHKRHLGGYM